MNLLILTTNTQHHKYFINKLREKIANLFVIYENKKIKYDFNTKHKELNKRDFFEKEYFKNYLYKKKIKSFVTTDINNKKSLNVIKKTKPQIIIDFGTSILKKDTIIACKKVPLLNFHGGNPTKYRGLDSHFWSIYHNDFKNLVTTLHYIDLGIDTGNIVQIKKINLNSKTNFYNLRIKNVENCIQLFMIFYDKYVARLKIPQKKQQDKGRYYSAFPSIFIKKCINNLNSYNKNHAN